MIKISNQDSYIVVICLLYVILIIIISEEPTDEKSPFRTKIIAHRGASGYAPENTFAAFDKAVEYEADYIELDVQMCKDKELVVMHDATVNRTTNSKGAIKDLNLVTLQELDAGSWYHSTYKGEKIPTLKEVVNRYKDKAGLLIEVKYPEIYPGIEKEIAKVVKDVADKEIIIQSFNINCLKRIKKFAPNLSTCLLLNGYETINKQTAETYLKTVKYVSPPSYTINQSLVETIKSEGLQVFAWTVNYRSHFMNLVDLGVDGIVTDYPDILKGKKEEPDVNSELFSFISRIYQFLMDTIRALQTS